MSTSILVTPQQHEDESLKYWPAYYKHDRDIANDFVNHMATEFINDAYSTEFQSLHDSSSSFRELLTFNLNKRQRDLLERFVDPVGQFFHDTEHEFRVRRGEGVEWEKVKEFPKPPPFGQLTNEPEESEGEEIPPFTFSI